ncbi:MAG: prepilin peptidase, partial [Elusimicrobiaceae bacterium]|nr:prepilin peptidase [Elusimicrobiaceae bacterium]
MDLATNILLILVGLIVGSFLNVCIYRIPIKKSLIAPASSCP